jgi:hypothetical protein
MLESLLLQRSSSVLDKWFDAVLGTYPPDTKRFLKKQKDRFANPVGTTLFKEMENLYQELLRGLDREKSFAILDRIIRIRAVQDFPPSEAVGFLFSLKAIIRSELESEIRKNDLNEELFRLDERIDDLVLLAFDIYMQCKEKIFEIRVSEAKNHVSRLLRKAELICEIPQEGAVTNNEDGNTIHKP